MYAATAGLVVVSLAIAVFAGPLSAVTGRAGADLVARDGYRVAVLGSAGDGARADAAQVRPRLLEIGWLTLVWVLLWGTFTPLSIVGGVVVAVAVIGAFRFPPAEAHLPFRPLRLLGLVGYLAYDMVVSGAEVSWQTLRYGPAARGRGLRGAAAEQLGPGRHGDRERPVAVARRDGAADRPRARAVVRLRARPARRGRGGAHPPPHDGHAAAGDRGARHPEELAAADAGWRRGGTGRGCGVRDLLAMLGVAAALTLYRLLRGPTTLDRIVALDVFVVLTVVAAAVYVAFYRDGSNIPLLAAVALVGFVGSTAAARLAVRRERHR